MRFVKLHSMTKIKSTKLKFPYANMKLRRAIEKQYIVWHQNLITILLHLFYTNHTIVLTFIKTLHCLNLVQKILQTLWTNNEYCLIRVTFEWYKKPRSQYILLRKKQQNKTKERCLPEEAKWIYLKRKRIEVYDINYVVELLWSLTVVRTFARIIA